MKPYWAKSVNSKESTNTVDPECVVKWLRVITILSKSTQKVENQLDDKIKLRYKALAQRAIVELIVHALEIFKSTMEDKA